jgi:hypothetical protein
MIDERFDAWMRALEQRHLADLRIQEVTRALRALSSVYVERRDVLKRGAALETAGKRAAFALFYGPLHYLVAHEIARRTGADAPGVGSVVDVGCGTGAVGAAWACAVRRAAPGWEPAVAGFDRHPWAVAEASWTYRSFGLNGSARREDVRHVRLKGLRSAVVAAFTVNELAEDVREVVLPRLLKAAADGARVLVIEPIAKPAGGWWDSWRVAFEQAGGREDTWRLETELPDLVRTLDRAAGLDHRVLTARSLYVDGGSPKSERA